MSDTGICLTELTIMPDDPRPGRRKQNRGLAQAYDLRDLAAKEVEQLRQSPLAEDETLAHRAQAISAMIRAWDVASSRIRILRGRPLPGSLKPQPRVRTKPAALPPPTESA